MNDNHPGPLNDIRVVDLANERGELAGRLLADLGAEVIKVEPPGGARARQMPPFDESAGARHGESLYWAAVALGKKSVVLDLDSSSDHERLVALVQAADVFIESSDPGEMAARGLGYEALRALNPRLVYISVTPYGQDGPKANWPASELTIEAAGGLLGLQGDGDRPPIPVGYPQPYFHAGAQAAADAVIALCEREHSGLGQHLDVSAQAAVVWTLMNATGYPPNTGGDPPTTGEGRTKPPIEIAPGVVFPSVWPCADGYVLGGFTLGGLGARTLRNLLKRMAKEGELSPELITSNWIDWTEEMAPGAVDPELLRTAKAEIAHYFQTHTGEQIMQRAVEEMLLIAPIRSIPSILAEPQTKARDYWQEVGGRKHPGASVKLSRTPIQLAHPAPQLGEHQSLLNSPAPGVPKLTAPAAPRRRAFEGLKVADFAWVGVGPIIAKALSDHGADVIHVESSTRPDVLRLGPPFRDGVAGLDRSQFFANFNTSKRSLALNLALPGGREVAHRLIDWADVVVESFSPGVAASLGISYADLAPSRPDLVMLSTCLCGQTGPYATFRGFGTQGSALAGLHGLTGWPDRPPKGTWGAYTDFIAPRYGVPALAAAIRHRERTGEGQHLDLAQVEAALHFVEPALLDYAVNGRELTRHGLEWPGACPHGVYRTAGEERYIAIAAETPEQWRALRGIAPLDAFANDDCEAPGVRALYRTAIDKALAEWCADKDGWELAEQLTKAGVPASVVERPSDLYEDAQLAHRGFFVTDEHAVMGPTPYDGPVTLFSETPPRVTAAPALGQHTEAVLTEILALAPEEIAEYAAQGVFA